MNWARFFDVAGQILRAPDKFAWLVFRIMVTAHVLLYAGLTLFTPQHKDLQVAHLEGTITDQYGHGVSVAVELRPGTGPPYQTASDVLGAFHIQVPPGSYDLFVESCGRETPMMAIRVSASQVLRLPSIELDSSHCRSIPHQEKDPALAVDIQCHNGVLGEARRRRARTGMVHRPAEPDESRPVCATTGCSMATRLEDLDSDIIEAANIS